MRLGLNRRYVFHRSKKMKIYIPAVLLCFFIAAGYISANFMIKVQPVFAARAEAYADSVATDSVDRAVAKVFEKKTADYNELVDIKCDNNGKVVSLSANASKINSIKSEMAKEIQNELSDNEYGKIGIPMGSILFDNIFQGIGPKLTFTVAPIGTVNTDFDDEFTADGINQVRHKLYLNVEVTVSIISAATEKSKTVANHILIAETVIVGNTPEYYSENAPINTVME